MTGYQGVNESLDPITYQEDTRLDCEKNPDLHDGPLLRARIGNDYFVHIDCQECGEVVVATMGCYLCDEFRPPIKRVVREFTTPGADPTQAFRLECGHSVIDL